VKETSKSVGLLLAKAATEKSNKIIKNDDIMRNSVKNLEIKIEDPKKLDSDVNKVIPIIHMASDISKTLKDNEEKLPEEEKLKLKEKQWELVNLAREVKSQKAKDLCNFYFNFFVFSNQKKESKPFELSKSAFIEVIEDKPLKMSMSGEENPSSNVSEIPQPSKQELHSSSTYVVPKEESTDFPDLLSPPSSPPLYDKNKKPKVKMKKVTLKSKPRIKCVTNHPPVVNFNDMNLKNDSWLFN
jgi:hypothetical protein